MLLENKIALVTGGSGGLGSAICVALAKEGAKVALTVNHNLAKGEAIAKHIRELGFGEAMVLRGQVDNSADVKAIVDAVTDRWGTVDILVNNAGITSPHNVSTISEAEWDKVMCVNVKGHFLFSQAVIPFMKEKGEGRIINMGSLTAKNGGYISGGVYIASKGAIHSLTYAMAKELAPYHITVNAVAPGPIWTDMIEKMPEDAVLEMVERIPLHRVGRPEEVAHAVVFLASPLAGFITGEVLDINGGAHTD